MARFDERCNFLGWCRRGQDDRQPWFATNGRHCNCWGSTHIMQYSTVHCLTWACLHTYALCSKCLLINNCHSSEPCSNQFYTSMLQTKIPIKTLPLHLQPKQALSQQKSALDWKMAVNTTYHWPQNHVKSFHWQVFGLFYGAPYLTETMWPVAPDCKHDRGSMRTGEQWRRYRAIVFTLGAFSQLKKMYMFIATV